jgi:hypothetical protein
LRDGWGDDGGMRSISDDERRARLALRHALVPARRVGDVVSAVEAMTCLHATEPASVYLSAFARAEVSRTDIDKALYDERSVVKQLAMRRTVFAFPRSLLPAVWGSAADRVAGQQRAQLAKDVVKGGIADDGPGWVEATTSDVLALLTSRGPMTTMQLRGEIPSLDARHTVAGGKAYTATVPIAPRVLTTLAAEGVILRGANDGGWKTSRPLWTTTETWLGEPATPLKPDEGYAALVSSWLRTFGPGTEADIVWWLGATKAAVRQAIVDVGAVEVSLDDGTTGWVHADDTDGVAGIEPWGALLPALDPTTMGWKERAFYLGPHTAHVFDSNGNGGPTAWWDGRIVGGWHQRDDGEVVVELIDDIGADGSSALDVEAARLTRWLAGDVVNTIYQTPLIRELRKRT